MYETCVLFVFYSSIFNKLCVYTTLSSVSFSYTPLLKDFYDCYYGI